MRLPDVVRPVVCISQARMGSTRLPGKVMKPVLERPLLWWHLSRLKRARLIDRLVLAVPDEPASDVLAALARSLEVGLFRGSETDVLSRYAGAAAASGAVTIVRVTSDCPLIDPALIDRALDDYGASVPALDYLRVDTDRIPRGFDAEIFTRRALDEADGEARDAAEREHVAPFIWKRPARYRIGSFADGETERHAFRLCVDEPADYDVVRHVLTELAPRTVDFGWRDVVALLRERPDWARLNADVQQKHV